MNRVLARVLAAEAVGTALLVATVIGSGIMGERLAGGNVALALLANTLATGSMLTVLILVFQPISGAHFNPVVSFVLALRREVPLGRLTQLVAAQTLGAIAGVMLAHTMFDESVVQISTTVRAGPAQWVSEFVATFGLVLTILGAARGKPTQMAYAVGLYIAAGYWFTASTCFANPAVTVARSLSDTFAGIDPAGVPAFVAAQFTGGLTASWFFAWLANRETP